MVRATGMLDWSRLRRNDRGCNGQLTRCGRAENALSRRRRLAASSFGSGHRLMHLQPLLAFLGHEEIHPDIVEFFALGHLRAMV